MAVAATTFIGAPAALASTASPIALQSGVPVITTVFEDDGVATGVVTLLNDSAWFTFSALAGTGITVSAENASDTTIELYFGDVTGLDFGSRDADFGLQRATLELTFVGQNDDFSGFNSFLSLTASSTGAYSLLVTDLFVTSIQTTVTATYTAPVSAPVPLPAPAALLLAGLAGLGLVRRRRKA